jgi:hypothetical protein
MKLNLNFKKISNTIKRVYFQRKRIVSISERLRVPASNNNNSAVFENSLVLDLKTLQFDLNQLEEKVRLKNNFKNSQEREFFENVIRAIFSNFQKVATDVKNHEIEVLNLQQSKSGIFGGNLLNKRRLLESEAQKFKEIVQKNRIENLKTTNSTLNESFHTPSPRVADQFELESSQLLAVYHSDLDRIRETQGRVEEISYVVGMLTFESLN